jgi:TetR/AcrR family transcriptional regulator, transcriptional repressor for nem operon
MDNAARTPRTRAPEQRREQLLDAAENVLLRQGLSASTIADVAAAAGVAKGTVYLYFESKDALLAGLRSRYLTRFADAVDSSVSSVRASPQTRLDRFVDGLFEFSVVNQALHHLLFHEAGFSEDDALAGARSILERVLADGVTSGVFDPNDPAISAGFLLHGLHGLLVDAMRADAAQRQRYTSAARELARRSVTRGGKTLS